MVTFLYWAIVKGTGEKVNFIDADFYEIGTEVTFKNQIVTIVDVAVEEDPISCEELGMQEEDFRYGY